MQITDDRIDLLYLRELLQKIYNQFLHSSFGLTLSIVCLIIINANNAKYITPDKTLPSNNEGR